MMSAGTTSREVFDAFSSFVLEDGIKLHYHDAGTWLLQCEAHTLPQTKPLHAVLNHSMRPVLEALESNPFWLRLLTEAQMFLSHKNVAMNGIWLWGSGPLHMPRQKPLVLVSDDKAWCKALERLSTHVRLYEEGMRLPKKGVYFMPDASSNQHDKLKLDFEQQHPTRFWSKLWPFGKNKHED